VATINFGAAAPVTENINLDSLFSTTLANYRKKLIDQISTTNAFMHELMKPATYESADSGTHIHENLLYGLSDADAYAGFDELPTLPTDGMTAALFEFRNMAAACSYSMEQVRANRSPAKLIDFVSSKVKQCELGLQESFGTALWQGAGSGALTTPKQSPVNGAFFIDPIGKMISTTPTTGIVGGIDASISTNSWWRNQASDFTGITTYDAFMLKMQELWVACSLGTGGTPKLICMDPTTYNVFLFAQYTRYRQTVAEVPNYPFEATKYKTAIVVMDEKIPDYKNNVVSYATAGSMVMINPAFMKLRYDSSLNFEWLKDDAGKSFAKPVNGDSRVGHMAWRGQLTINNRKKQGIGFGIPRSLVA